MSYHSTHMDKAFGGGKEFSYIIHQLFALKSLDWGLTIRVMWQFHQRIPEISQVSLTLVPSALHLRILTLSSHQEQIDTMQDHDALMVMVLLVGYSQWYCTFLTWYGSAKGTKHKINKRDTFHFFQNFHQIFLVGLLVLLLYLSGMDMKMFLTKLRKSMEADNFIFNDHWQFFWSWTIRLVGILSPVINT